MQPSSCQWGCACSAAPASLFWFMHVKWARISPPPCFPGPASIRSSEYIRGIFIMPSYLLHHNKLPRHAGRPFSECSVAKRALAQGSFCKHCWINLPIEHINLSPVQMPTSNTEAVLPVTSFLCLLYFFYIFVWPDHSLVPLFLSLIDLFCLYFCMSLSVQLSLVSFISMVLFTYFSKVSFKQAH